MCKILIVEDEPHQRWLYCEGLKREGHQVIAVGRGEQALSVLRYMPIDLVVLDLVLPDGNGLDYLEKILQRDPDMKVIINSAYPTFKEDFRSWGASRFITKRSDLSELTKTINELASRSQDGTPAEHP